MNSTCFLCFVIFLALFPNKGISNVSENSKFCGVGGCETKLVLKTCLRTTFNDFCRSYLDNHGGNKSTNLQSLAALTLKLAHSQVLTIHKELKSYCAIVPSYPDIGSAEGCLKAYDDVVYGVKKSIAALSHKKYDDVFTWMNSAITYTVNTTTNGGDLSDTELGLEFAAEVENLKKQKEAMKKSKELLFVDMCRYLAMESDLEAVKRKWRNMEEDEKLGFVKEFVRNWGFGFHPISTRAAKEMIDEYVCENDDDDVVVAADDDSFLLKVKKFMGF
ncbi:hypothetical protein ACFE04_002498 [Oxalis oulophora]